MKASENGGNACLGTAGMHRLDDSTLVELAIGINTKSTIMRDTTTKEEGQKATPETIKDVLQTCSKILRSGRQGSNESLRSSSQEICFP